MMVKKKKSLFSSLYVVIRGNKTIQCVTLYIFGENEKERIYNFCHIFDHKVKKKKTMYLVSKTFADI